MDNNIIRIDNIDFYRFQYGTKFKDMGGVYIITDINYKALYVGHTNNLQERHSSHHKEHCFNVNKATYIYVHVEQSETVRIALEKHFIGEYQPTCNTVGIT